MSLSSLFNELSHTYDNALRKLHTRTGQSILVVFLLIIVVSHLLEARVLDDIGVRAKKKIKRWAKQLLSLPFAENAKYYWGQGNRYKEGWGVPKDPAEAMKWYRKAANLGNVNAQFMLGLLYRYGNGVPQDYAEAAKWYRKAADLGYTLAQKSLGEMYEEGQGMPQDYAEAMKWYREAADLGYGDACERLGEMYEKGCGVPQNSSEAAQWYRKAANLGDGEKQYELGLRFQEGRGITRDDTEAVWWYRRAAEKGNLLFCFRALFQLGFMHYLGHGVPQDYVLAHKWVNIAASNLTGPERDKAEKTRDEIEAKMTPAQIAEAQKLARDWWTTPWRSSRDWWTTP